MARWHDVVTTLLRLLRNEDLNLDLYSSSALYYVLMISDTPPFSCHQILVHFRREEEERATILRVYYLIRTQVRPSSAVASNLIREMQSMIVNGYAQNSSSVENFYSFVPPPWSKGCEKLFSTGCI